MQVLPIHLRHGPWSAAVRPDVGGSLAGLWLQRREGDRVAVLRAARADATGPLQMASFPLVPYCNRIEHGRFRWHGRGYVLPPNHAGDAFPLHGDGWYASWRVDAVAAAAVDLELGSSGSTWPWPYVARQRYALDDEGLRIELSVRNLGDTAMPAGLGHHPYFPRDACTLVRAHLPVLWDPDERLIPRGPVANPLAAQFAAGCSIATVRLDCGYTGWDGRCTIERPDERLRVELIGAPGAFHLYVPDAGFFCAEAVTNQPNAINDARAAAPMIALAPGAWLHYEMRLRATSHDAAPAQISA